jgi:hypothetical protein
MRRVAGVLAVATAMIALGTASAGAAPCNNCPPEGPEGPGGAPPGPPPPSVVTGTFRYRHPLDAGGKLKPIRGAALNVIAEGASEFTMAAVTDQDGRFRMSLPYRVGTRVTVEVLARNDAADVLDETVGQNPTFRALARDATGGPLSRTVTSSGVTLDFSTDFTDAGTARYYNAAEVIARGRAYADAHRDPRETDAIGRARVVFGTLGSPAAWYDPTSSTIRLLPSLGFEDLAILHEYGHYLENHIGTFLPLPSTHGGCIATLAPFGSVNSPELAWMEGFADWFAQVVDESPIGTPDVSTPSRVTLDTPTDCGPLGTGFTTDAFEPHVAGFLWDLYDRANDVLPGRADDDSFSRADGQVFQIMDRELDVPAGAGPWPRISTFRDAWYARGWGWLDPILTLNNIHTYDGSRPAPEPIPAPTPDPKVCLHKPYLPGC